MADLKTVGWVGPLLLPTGYAEASREHVKSLLRVGVEVVGRLNQPVHPSLHNELIRDDHAVNECIQPPKGSPPQGTPQAWVWHVTPDAIPPREARPKGVPSLAYAVWECVGLPKGWAEAVNSTDGLLTCSPFSAEQFREGGVTVPIEVCPHPIDLDRFHPQVDGFVIRNLFPPAVKTLFLVVSQWMFRKGIEDVLVAYLSEFRHDEPVGMALLTWRGSHRWAEKQAIRSYIRFVKVGLNLEKHPRLWYVGDKLEREDLPKWYAASDVLVSASRGEAFGLPFFEAGACGRPSISTGWGGQWNFLSEESAWSVPFEMEPVHGSGPQWRHYHAGQFWGRPSIVGLRKTMREAHENDELRRRKGQAAFEVVAERLAYPKAGLLMKEALERALDRGQAVV